jgi:hypothetical protein
MGVIRQLDAEQLNLPKHADERVVATSVIGVQGAFRAEVFRAEVDLPLRGHLTCTRSQKAIACGGYVFQS